MVRLMLVLAPVMCILAGIGVSSLLNKYMKVIHVFIHICGVLVSRKTVSCIKSIPLFLQNLDVARREKKTSKKTTTDSSYPMKNETATGIVFLVTMFLLSYTFHCTWVTSEAYSSPSIVLSARQQDGSRVIFDDFREAYYWLSQNTPEVRLLFELTIDSLQLQQET